MDIVLAVAFVAGIFYLSSSLFKYLGKIVKNLKIIRLQLEIQNPLFVSDELLLLDKNINYWQKQMWAYKDDISKENKEISDLTFSLFWAYVDRLNHFRVMISEAQKTGDPTKVHEQNEKWLEENEEKTEKLEEQVIAIDSKIKQDLEKRDLDIEFLGKWDTEEY